MKKVILTNLLLIMALTMFGHDKGRHNHSDFFKEMQAGDKAAILMIHFGSTHTDARLHTIDVMNDRVKQAFPDLEVREAYTSRIIIKRLGDRGVKKQKPTEALEQLRSEGYTHILVQTSAIIDGVEMESLTDDVDEVRNLFKDIRVGDPLLYTPQDYERVIDVLTKNTDKTTAYILVGHGTYDAATAQYTMLDYMLKSKGHSNFFVGTLEGYPEFDNVLQQLKTTKIKNVVLIPFLFAAGEHAKKDIAVEWKQEFEKLGYKTEVRMHGLGQNPQIQDIYIEHIRFAALHRKININDKKREYEQTGEKE